MIYAICNPAAASGHAAQTGEMIDALLEEKGIEHRMAQTEGPGHATELARQAAEEGAETVLSIGGDGTALEVAKGLIGTDSALGIVPAGTGNDFVKTLGIPRDPAAAMDFILNHPARPTDAGEINGQLFLNETGTGFDVSVLDYAAKAKRYVRGILPYLYGVLRTLFRFRSVPVTWSTEGSESTVTDAFVVAAGNGGIIGGGIPIAPEARADDGLLDVVIVGRILRRNLPARLAGLMRGKILEFPETTWFRAKSFRFSVPGGRANVDGEIPEMKEAEVRILPGALRIHR